jgi:Kef-type K+ transport system membrane component KefB
LGKIKQPKVIAEVLGGILLGQIISPIVLTAAHSFVGPTAMGRIPGFTQHIFPIQSLPYLSLVANIGLCLFLFIVGLEIDGSVIKRSVRSSLFIALSAMALSFALGSAISVPLYHNFILSTVKFTYFVLFTGLSFSITAFPVLCRILTALQLLDTTVGVIVLSAGVCNDVVG